MNYNMLQMLAQRYPQMMQGPQANMVQQMMMQRQQKPPQASIMPVGQPMVQQAPQRPQNYLSGMTRPTSL